MNTVDHVNNLRTYIENEREEKVLPLARGFVRSVFLLRRRIETFTDFVNEKPEYNDIFEGWILDLLKIENDLNRLTQPQYSVKGSEDKHDT